MLPSKISKPYLSLNNFVVLILVELCVNNFGFSANFVQLNQ
ncbi:hypothetical protein PTUN_b0771 [Pseudoalteromonas tunicata]|nr:hypothetical protein PTUN_b0771 [Pseudoalteromonas tunicata]